MARIPEDLIQRVRESADLVEIISRFVTLKRSGKSFTGLCPFHDDHNPSFHVWPESQRYKCFVCDEGGNVFTFLMKHNKMEFREVIEDLARSAGIQIEEQGPRDETLAARRTGALEALRFAAGFFRVVLSRNTGREAQAYLRERGFTPETLEAFTIGYAPNDWEALGNYARSKGFSQEALLDAGLLRRRDDGRIYDMFRGRIMFPIHDLRGHVIGFGARAMGDDKPKYLNSPDGPLFRKGRELYGLHLGREAAHRAGRILVMEGYTDVLACRQAGLHEAVAGLGTALTVDNARNLRRVGVPVFLLYDGDEAGQRAAERAVDVLLAERVEGAVAILPKGQDPADILTGPGRETLERILDGAKDLFDFRLEQALFRYGEGSLHGETRAIEEVLGVIGEIGDPVRRDVAFKLLAERVSVPESTLRNSVRRRARPAGGPPVEESPPASGWPKMEGELVIAALKEPALWSRVEQIYPPAGFADPALREVAIRIGRLVRDEGAVTREALWASLEGADEALFAFERLDEPDDVVQRATQHLQHLVKQRTMRAARQETTLAAVRRARARHAEEPLENR